jgi:hypothetical protein
MYNIKLVIYKSAPEIGLFKHVINTVKIIGLTFLFTNDA